MGNDRSELHKKVEIRQKELQKVLANAEREGHPAKRIEALRTELSVVENATTGGWDKMAEVTAVELTHWLDATQPLLDMTPGRPAPVTVREKPQVQVSVDGSVSPGPSVKAFKPAPNAGIGNAGPDIRSTVANNETSNSNSGNSAEDLGVTDNKS